MSRTDMNATSPFPMASSVAMGRMVGSTHWSYYPRVSGVFAAGTLIDTPYGQTRIELLGAGDEILSRKNGKIAVGDCLVVPDHAVPDTAIRIQAGSLDAVGDLYVLPQQLVRLNHWLVTAMFGTRFPFVNASEICSEGKVELVPRKQMQFYQIHLGVCDAITANGVMCAVDDFSNPDRKAFQRGPQNYEYRELTKQEAREALDLGNIYRRRRSRGCSLAQQRS